MAIGTSEEKMSQCSSNCEIDRGILSKVIYVHISSRTVELQSYIQLFFILEYENYIISKTF